MNTNNNWSELRRLQLLAIPAIRIPALVELARFMSPSLADKTASQKSGVTEEQVQACRYLAIIRRDFGNDAFNAAVRDYNRSEVTEFLENELIPRIHLLEAITGSDLIISRPAECELTFAQLLRRDLPSALDVQLVLGEFEIDIRTGMKQRESLGKIRHYSTFYFRVVHAHSSKVLSEDAWELWDWALWTKEIDPKYLQMHYLGELLDIIGYRDSTPRILGKPSIIAAILNYFESRGQLLPPQLEANSEIKSAAQQGAVERVKQLIDEAGNLWKKSEPDPGLVAYFDFEAAPLIKRAMARRRFHDPDVPLEQKVMDQTVEAPIGLRIIFGTPPKKTYNFFLYYDSSVLTELWIEILKEFGYAGSTFFWGCTISCGQILAETGQVDGVFLDHSDWFCGWLHKFDEHVKARGLQSIPSYQRRELGSPNAEKFKQSLGEFLKKHFPLE